MNAKKLWFFHYAAFTDSRTNKRRIFHRNAMYLVRREAALERIIARQQRDIAALDNKRCEWLLHYDKQGYPIYRTTCGSNVDGDDIDTAGLVFCPYCRGKLRVNRQ